MTVHAFQVLITATDPATGDRTPISLTFVAESADQAQIDAETHPHAARWHWVVGSVTEVPAFENAI